MKDSNKKEVVLFGKDQLEKEARIGMSKVDPMDIRPPQVRLIQKSSKADEFADTEGNHPKVGQYFHNGRMKIFDTFECYILMAAKGSYIDRRKEAEGEKPQYKAVGVMADDYSIFGMTFRSSALYCLAPLYTAACSQRRPMYSFKVKFEVKELENEKGAWSIPVLRIESEESDEGKLAMLSELAKGFDVKAEEIAKEQEEDEVSGAVDRMQF